MLKKPTSPSLDGLYSLASNTGVDIQPTLLRVLTDLYVQKPVHTAAETAQYVELALRLIDVVDPTTRSIAAARLSAYRGAPEVVLQRMVAHGALPHMPEIRQPASLTVPHAAAAAPAAPASAAAISRPSEMALTGENDLAVLFLHADPDERRLILANMTPAPHAGRLAPRTNIADISRRLEAAALQRNPREFASLLERALSISPAMAERITIDATGEPIVVIARALGMKADALQRILLFLNPQIGMSVQRVYDLAGLFSELSAPVAETMLDVLRDAGARRRSEHQPVYWDDEKTSARSASTPAQRTVARRGAPLLDRYRGNGR